jgi:ElaB/YqjD/DUF883 family membrane-anchored ribosome-binding protein
LESHFDCIEAEKARELVWGKEERAREMLERVRKQTRKVRKRFERFVRQKGWKEVKKADLAA